MSLVQALPGSRRSRTVPQPSERGSSSPPQTQSTAAACPQTRFRRHESHAPRRPPSTRPACKKLLQQSSPWSAENWELVTDNWVFIQNIHHRRKRLHKLIADLRTSPIEANGSRAPSLAAIHFFSLPIMSSNNFLSSAEGKYSFKCCS